MEGSLLKAQLRKDMRLRRNSINPKQRQVFDLAIQQAVLDVARQSSVSTVSAFLPFDGEPDLRPALTELAVAGLEVYLPVICGEGGDKHLEFNRWYPDSELHPHPFGLLEPSAGETLASGQLDLMLMPLVAWDECGRRLGMGAGYYDRALSGLKDAATPVRTGIAYQLQKCEALPEDPWDIRLHQLISETGRFTCTG